MSEPVLKTLPRDRRFPNTNQAQHCWTLYNEWILCLNKTGGDEDSCTEGRWKTKTICPNEWVDNWDEQRENGNFPGIKSTYNQDE